MEHKKNPLAAALGAAFLATALTPVALAETDPFVATQLNGGYDLVNYGEEGEADAEPAEGKCGEGSCGEGDAEESEEEEGDGEGEAEEAEAAE